MTQMPTLAESSASCAMSSAGNGSVKLAADWFSGSSLIVHAQIIAGAKIRYLQQVMKQVKPISVAVLYRNRREKHFGSANVYFWF